MWAHEKLSSVHETLKSAQKRGSANHLWARDEKDAERWTNGMGGDEVVITKEQVWE